MALPKGKEDNQFNPVTHKELWVDLASCLSKLESTMLEKFKALMDPLQAQLQEVQQNLTQLAQTMDTAMELGLTNQESSRQLQKNSD